MSDDVKTNVLCCANKALNKFGLTSDEIAMHIEGLINRTYRNEYGHCDCVIVDQTVSDDTLVKHCSSRSYNYYFSNYLCFALKGLKIGLNWDGKNHWRVNSR